MEKQETTSPRHSDEKSTTIVESRDGTIETQHGGSNSPSLDASAEKVPVAATNTEEWEYVTGFKLAAVNCAVTAACFVMLLDTSIVATAIPRITSDFHSLEDIGWYGSSFLIANAALQPLTGKLYNQFSSKFTFIFFIALFELGSLLCGVATSSKMLIVGRAVAGMGGSGLMNGALTIISACVPLHTRALYFGIMTGIAQLGILFGPLLGGALTEYASWRWCFYINLPIGGIVVGFLFFIHIPDRRPKSQVEKSFRSIPKILNSLDIFGFILFAPTAIMFLLALEWGGTKYSWNSGTVIGLFCGSAGMLLVFLAWQYKRGDTAMIPLSLFRIRIVVCSCLTQFFMAANLLTTSYYMAVYFQAVRGVAPMLSGVYLLPSILSQMFGAVLSGALVSRLGYYLPWAIASAAIASVGAGLLSTLSPTTVTVAWVFFQIIGGTGRGLGMQMTLIAVQNTLPPEQNSVGMALLIFNQGLGGALFQSFAQIALTNGLKNALPHFAPNVNAQMVIDAGATGIRSVVAKVDLRNVLLAYSQAVNHVFYLTTGAALGGFVFSFGLGWKSVKKAKAVAPEADADGVAP